MNIAVIIPAAGAGTRFGAAGKIEQDLAGRPVFLRSVELFAHRPHFGRVILAVNPDTIGEFRFRWGDRLAFHDVVVVPGGKTERWETVANALKEVGESFTHVAVHDAARPLASARLIERIVEAGQRYPAVIPATPVSATLKRIADLAAGEQHHDPLASILGDAPESGVVKIRRVVETIDRTDVVEVQTPQLFEVNLLRRAYRQIADGAIDPATITDDAGLVEALGETVYVVPGETMNLKITRPDDLPLAAAIHQLQHQQDTAADARKRLFGDDDD